jgi:tRNA 2-thiouridine synthesizing protein A
MSYAIIDVETRNKVCTSSTKILLKASDPNSEIDILRYCQLQKRQCQMIKISEHELHYIIE